jgi:putative ABC transport system permease protein
VRLLWVKAPLLLRRHPPVLAAVLLTTALSALAAAAVPLVRAGVEGESLAAQVREMSPLAAGFEIRVLDTPIAGSARRRAAAARLARSIPFLGPPVVSSLLPVQVEGSGLDVVALSRTGAVAHVHHVAQADNDGVWIADSAVKVTHLRPGNTLRLTIFATGVSRVVTFPIAGIYRSLEGDRDNPYWANWLQDIRSIDPNSPPPPTFVLMRPAQFDRLARTLLRNLSGPFVAPVVESRYEFPVDPRHLSFADAERLDARFDRLGGQLLRPGDPFGRALNCRPRTCRTGSSLRAALTIAASDVAAVSPTISLLSGIGLAISLGLSAAAGFFLARRRADEMHVLFARGEAPAAVAARTVVEAALPALAGGAAGLGIAVLVLHSLAPTGTVTAETVGAGAWRAAAAVAAAVACIAAGAFVAFPRRTGVRAGRARHLALLPWEIVPIAVAAVLLAIVLAGRGLASDANGANHPRLAVFLVPVVAVAGVAGIAVRAGRRLLARRGGRTPPVIFLALRRLGAARGLLVAVVVAAATAFGTFAYAATLSASLGRSAAEKAFVGNGSDVQGVVDPAVRLTQPLPFPAAVVEVDETNVSLPSGQAVDLVAGDPRALARTLRWGDGWANDPRPLLPRLLGGEPGRLRAIASPGAPDVDAIFDQGARIPVDVVGHAAVPGTSAGRPALLVSRAALRREARRVHILEPGPTAGGFVWAKGDPGRIMPVLERSSLAPVYLTGLDHIRDAPSVAAAERSYRYVKLIGVAAAVLALVALLLYLQARHRSQLIATALTRRMGLAPAGDAAALVLEAGAVVLFAAVVGGAVATAAAAPLARHVDSLPQYAPPPVLTVPWTTLGLGLAAAVCAALVIGAVAALLASRSDVAEALRVA